MIEKLNLSMLTDYYEITMANGYFVADMSDEIAYFDMFFRKIPEDGGYVIMAGLEQVIEYLKKLEFSEEDIAYLRSKGIFNDAFLEYLANFKFTCDVWAIPEGTPIFPGEPLITVRGPVMQAQFVETMILLLVNHQSLIATKASRIVRAAQGRPVMEFGTRRSHGTAAAVYGARASYIGGCAGTACTIADEMFGTPALGTMAHSWVQMFDNEYEAFKKYTEIYPTNATLLVDTFNVLKSGIPAAIKVFKELDPPVKGIRIDSGDISYLTKNARKMLDEAGLEDCKIVISNSLDEHIIREVISEGACIDSFGVGEKLITSKSEPVFGGVYKLAALEKDGKMIPKIKISENPEKITNPGFKKIFRFFDKDTDRLLGDVITLRDEEMPAGDEYEIFDSNHIWKKKKITNFYVKELQEQIFKAGECVYESPDIKDIKAYCMQQQDRMWDEMKRFENPQTYYVDLSKKLWTLKHEMIDAAK